MNDIPHIRSAAGRLVISLAVQCGPWNLVMHKGSIDIVHPDGHVITVPADASSIRRDRLASWSRKIVRYTDPDEDRPDMAMILELAGVKAGAARDVEAAINDRWGKPTRTPDPVAVEVARKLYEETEPVAPAARVVVRTEPARAYGGGQRTYPSNATLQRMWSDGTIDYVCSHSGCDYSADNLRSVSSHRRTHGVVGVNPPDGFDPDHVPEPRVQSRIDALALELQMAMDAGHMTPSDIAAHIVRARIERRDLTTDDAPDLTPEDILRRIAILVDRGESVRLRADLEAARLSAVEAERAAAEASAEAAACAARADKAEGAMNALRELLND